MNRQEYEEKIKKEHDGKTPEQIIEWGFKQAQESIYLEKLQKKTDFENQFNLVHADKTPEQMMEYGASIAREEIAKEKKEVSNRISAMRAIFDVFRPKSNKRL